MSDQVRRQYAERARQFAAQQGWRERQAPDPEVWISVHDDYPVYALDEAPPPGMRMLSNRKVPVSAQTAERWKAAAEAYRQTQDEMAEAYSAAGG